MPDNAGERAAQPPGAGMAEPAGHLNEVQTRVVELSAFVAAPLAGMTLAGLGYDVVRIDPPGGGLDFHRWPVTGEGESIFWAGLNRGKRSVVVDFRRPEGRELVAAMIVAGQRVDGSGHAGGRTPGQTLLPRLYLPAMTLAPVPLWLAPKVVFSSPTSGREDRCGTNRLSSNVLTSSRSRSRATRTVDQLLTTRSLPVPASPC